MQLEYHRTLYSIGYDFLPSINEYSHRKDELTSYEECKKGDNVLLKAVLKLYRKKVNK
jgi:acetylornithine deacetylase/succinyl-diaminopimelate desuccinylase-like protein